MKKYVKKPKFFDEEKQVVKEAVYMWKWLKENPDKYEEDYPLYEKKFLGYYEGNPCCDFYWNKHKLKCDRCPLSDGKNNTSGCYGSESDYSLWFHSVKKGDRIEAKKRASILYNKLRIKYISMGGRIRYDKNAKNNETVDDK